MLLPSLAFLLAALMPAPAQAQAAPAIAAPFAARAGSFG